MTGKLYIVATPIGNLSDISERMKEALSNVDIVLAEDTRRTGMLLKHIGIKKKMMSFFVGNENKKTDSIIELLTSGQNIALVSDAGTPLISDPGFPLIRDSIQNEIEIIPIPGPSSILTALVASGLPCDRFTFAGYPPDKSGKRKNWLKEFSEINHTIIMFLSPWKVKFMLEDVLEILGDRPACLCRELTKIHEEFTRGKLSEIIEKTKDRKPKGEYVLVVGEKR